MRCLTPINKKSPKRRKGTRCLNSIYYKIIRFYDFLKISKLSVFIQNIFSYPLKRGCKKAVYFIYTAFLGDRKKCFGINKLSQSFSFGIPDSVLAYTEWRSLLIARKGIILKKSIIFPVIYAFPFFSCVPEFFNIPFLQKIVFCFKIIKDINFIILGGNFKHAA